VKEGQMVESTDLYRRFEQLIAELFQAEGFKVLTETQYANIRVDLFLISKTQKTAAVECKLFRTRQMGAKLLFQIMNQTEMNRRILKADRGVLVTGSRIPRYTRDGLAKEYPSIVVFDLDALRFIAAKYPKLTSQLEELVQEASISPEPDTEDRGEVYTTAVLDGPVREAPLVLERPRETAKGAQLCADIRNVKTGKSGARAFELTIEAALKYIFDTDLTAWSSQKVTDSGLSRYDLIARVSSEDDVWRMLRERFQSQYIIFECKNYTDKIKQGEVYTTEKYLFLRALRSVAFIISRNVAHQSALAAARGALREHGKLIVNLNVDEICRMLAMKDASQDYNGFLFDKIDDMLMKLER
jgi:hypothetical protein